MLCSPPWSCLCRVSGLSPNLFLVSQLVLQPGMLCPPPWSCLCLVSHLVSILGWSVVSPSLVLFFSCLRSCLTSGFACGLVCCVRLPGLVFLLSPVLSPNLPVLSFSRLRSCLPACLHPRMLCPPPWSCLCLVSGLVSHLVSYLGWYAVSTSLVLFSLVSGLVSQLVWDAVSAFLSCLSLVSGLVSQLVWDGLVSKMSMCDLCNGLGVYGGVILQLNVSIPKKTSSSPSAAAKEVVELL